MFMGVTASDLRCNVKILRMRAGDPTRARVQ